MFGTALGTTLLALGTGALAWFTARDVTATQQLAEAAREDQAAHDHPVVVVTDAEFVRIDGFDWDAIRVSTTNVALAPAVGVEIGAKYDDPVHRRRIASVLHNALAPGQTAGSEDIRVLFDPPPRGGIDVKRFTVIGTFLDRSLELRRRTPLAFAYGAVATLGTG